jgi:hypothetical protein
MNLINRVFTAMALGVLLLPGKGMAQVYTMSDGGSTATVNVGNTGTLGMNSWSVLNNQSQLNQQWFWYSVNGAAQQPINTISTATVFNFSNPASPLNDLGVTYSNSTLAVSVEYVLAGNGVGSGSADLTENLNIQNTGASSISLSFYQYSNFNLLQNNMNSVTISSDANGYLGATQTTGGPGGNGIAEVIEAPLANNAEAALAGQTLANLNGNSYYTLNGNTSAGPGDVTWAFQWNVTLDPNATLNIIKDKGLSIQIVPEPTTMAFVALGLGALGLARRRQTA